MKLYVLGKRFPVDYRGRHLIDVIHFHFYHGFDLRDLKDSHPFFKDDVIPMSLCKNIYNIGHVFQPFNIVCSDVVKERLSHIPNIKFIQVVFEKMFSLPYKADDYSVRQYLDPVKVGKQGKEYVLSKIKKYLTDDDIRPYYEMVVPFYTTVRGACKGQTYYVEPIYLRDYTLYKDLINYDNPSLHNIVVSDEAVINYPIFNAGEYFFSEKAFEAIKNFIDPIYFYALEYIFEDDPIPVPREVPLGDGTIL